MFKSLFSLVGRVVSLFTTAQNASGEKRKTENDEESVNAKGVESSGVSSDEPKVETDELELEVDEVDVFNEDWGGKIPQRASALFPQSIPTRAEPFDLSSGPITMEIGRNAPKLSEVKGRQTPSATQLFTEAEADIKPMSQPERPYRPYPQPHQPVPAEPVVQAAPPERQYSAYVQVGRLMKQDPPPPKPAQSNAHESPVIHRSHKRSRRRFIQPLGQPPNADAVVPLEQGAYRERRGAQMPPPPRGVSWGGEEDSPMAYHDVHGERGAISRSQVVTSHSDSEINPQLQLQPPELHSPINTGGLLESLRPTTPPPSLKPKPVRFTKGNYLRFWGNYSAQPSYLHFGSLIRSERFIDLLPIWHDELDELEDEAREEWSHLDGEADFEGEADWRRLLNPTMSSPIDFLLHRDRVEQLSLLPRGRTL